MRTTQSYAAVNPRANSAAHHVADQPPKVRAYPKALTPVSLTIPTCSVSPFTPTDLLILIVALVVLIGFVRYQRRKRAKVREQNQALFSQRLSEHRQSGPPNLSLLMLAQRQLADWEHLLVEMETSKAPAEQLRYCRQQVERFKKEVAWLRDQ